MHVLSVALKTSKATGVFRASRYLKKNTLLILCYHGFSIDDEAEFRPMMFMTPEVFERRLALLERLQVPVLPLGEALSKLRTDCLPDGAVSITIDDGFYSTLTKAAPILQKYSMPATLYTTSYYAMSARPIVRLAIHYMLWKTKADTLDVAKSGLSGFGQVSVDLADIRLRDSIAEQIVRFLESRYSEHERQSICETLGESLGVDYKEIDRTRILSLLGPDELRALRDFSIDVQLHTHRHTFAAHDPLAALKEIEDNRGVLEPIVGKKLFHFCYPSGLWHLKHWRVLKDAGLLSATTCEAGLNRATTPVFGLYRFVDSNAFPDIVLEAEVSGFGELVRTVTGKRRVRERARRSTDEVTENTW
jgi:peptidoglycan/xylan/chitin deacetylase (PgdA/CDA1 family)